jgi:hypothetical protein
MRESVKGLWTLGLIGAVVTSGCSPRKPIERDLQITLGGFVKGGNEQEKIEGTCTPVETGNVLNCDIYNGLAGWRITELVIRITWAPYSAEDVRDFRQRVTITPLTTVPVNLLLGMQLPGMRWGWIVVGAKGVPPG